MEWIPLLMGILAIPILIVVLLIVYIARTNRLSRDTSALQAEITALRNELARLTRSLAPFEQHQSAESVATSAIQNMQEQRGETLMPPSSPAEPDLGPPPAPMAPQRLPEPQAYVSPFRTQVSGERRESGPGVSQAGADPVTVESGSSLAVSSGSGSGSDQAHVAGRQPRNRAEWESLIGGRLLNWIGAVAIIIGIAFFLGYGYQNNWITPALLVTVGAVAGFALLAGGDLSFRRGYRIFSQGLIGAGISVLYLSVYASFNYFHLEGQATAFLMMSSVTVLTFVQAFRFDSLSVSLLGWAGGFLTPILLSTGVANEVALFAYISILDAGLLAIAAFKENWVLLQPLTLAATYAMYFAWYDADYTAADFTRTAAFLTIFWALFHALDISQVVRLGKRYLALREISAVLNAICFYVALYLIVDADHHDYLATITFGLGAAYLLTIAALKPKLPQRVTEGRFALTGAVLLVIATSLRFSGFDTVFCWAMESLALVLAAVYWKEPGVLGGALLLYTAAIVKLLATTGWFNYQTPESFVLLINRRSMAFIGLVLAGGLSAEAIRRAHRDLNRLIATLFEYSSGLALFALLAVETQDEFASLALNSTNPEWLHFVMYLAVGVVWMMFAVLLANYAAARGLSSSLNVALFAAGAAICTVAIAGFSYKPILEFSPILNIRAAAFVFVLFGLLVLLALSKSLDDMMWLHGALLTAFCLVILVLCTAETRDYFGSLLDSLQARNVQSAPDGEAFRRYTNLQQVALSLVWLVYSIALIGYGIWRRTLSLRIIAIAVFGIAILKIFIYDLSFLETLYRTFSFIGLGLILLSVSFLYQRYKSAIFESSPHPEPGS